MKKSVRLVLAMALMGLGSSLAQAGFIGTGGVGTHAINAAPITSIAYRTTRILAPRTLARLLHEQGYDELRIYRRNGDVYAVDADYEVRRFRLLVDARTAEVLEETVIGRALSYQGGVQIIRPPVHYRPYLMHEPQRPQFFAPSPRYEPRHQPYMRHYPQHMRHHPASERPMFQRRDPPPYQARQPQAQPAPQQPRSMFQQRPAPQQQVAPQRMPRQDGGRRHDGHPHNGERRPHPDRNQP